MSVQPQPWPQPAPEIVAAVAAMYRGKRERPLPVMVRDRLGEWLADEQFAGAYGVRGKPGWPPSRLALVTIFQMAEDLTDRQAAEAVRTRIDWKYALGLELPDPGFDDSILSEFRARVAAGGLDQVVLDTLLERLAADGLVRRREDAHRFHPCDRRGTRSEPAGAGRGVGAGVPGGPGGGRAALAGASSGRFVGQAVRRAGRHLADARLRDQERGAGAGVRPRRPHAAEGGVRRRGQRP